MEFISQNLTVIILAVIGLFAGITIAFRIVKNSHKNSNNNSSNTVNQQNNRVGGDQAGRDIKK
ncbi:MAG TPA: hypothetical protein VF556_16910 [Pyrinomonadaceae bacterium]|jgi:F0F1-type ATP synthase assembly protein I